MACCREPDQREMVSGMDGWSRAQGGLAVRGDHLRLRGHDDLAINADVGNAAATPTLPVEPRRARTHGTCDVGDWTQPSLSGTRQEGCISVSRMRVVSPRERSWPTANFLSISIQVHPRPTSTKNVRRLVVVPVRLGAIFMRVADDGNLYL